jgi:transcriptional regulator with XRE-family HTH domain
MSEKLNPWEIFSGVLKKEKLTKASAARRLGVTKALLTNWASGHRNMSLDSLELYLSELGYRLEVKVKKI